MAKYIKDINRFDVSGLTLVNSQRERIAEKINACMMRSSVVKDEDELISIYGDICAYLKLADDTYILDNLEALRLQSYIDDFFNGIPSGPIEIPRVKSHVHEEYNNQSLIMLEKVYVQESIQELFSSGAMTSPDDIQDLADCVQKYLNAALALSIINQEEMKDAKETLRRFCNKPDRSCRIELVPREFYNKIY